MYTPISELVGKDLSELGYIWEHDFDQLILSVENDPDVQGHFIVHYLYNRRTLTDKGVHSIREAYRDNEDELNAELETLRRQVAVLEHDRRMLQQALLEHVGIYEADRIMNDIRASTPKPSED